jgi:nickel-dependent lactate racemase
VIVTLPCGTERLAVDLRGLRVRPLAPSAPGGGDPARIVGDAVDRPLSGPSLAELARGRGNAVLVVPDATRRVELPRILPVLLGRLREAGVPADRTLVAVACGTHPGLGAAGARELVGELPAGVELIEHDSRDEASLIAVGELRPGLPLRLHRRAVEAGLLVTVGTVRHHYFAGFGGGPKMIFPGLAGHTEIQANHALVMSASPGGGMARHPGCEPGLLVGNPVAEEIRRGAALRPPDLAVCLVRGRDGGTAWAAAGPLEQSFAAAVERVRTWFEVPAGPPFELMVAAAGGAPEDRTLIQAHKALDAASRFLAPGGELLFVAALDGGAGSPAMEPFLADPSPAAIAERLASGWVQYGHTTLRLVEKTGRYTVRLHSGLAPELALRLGFVPVAGPAEVADRWRAERPGATVGVMVSGAVYPRA